MSKQTPYLNKWGEEVLDQYTEIAVSSTDPAYNTTAVWQLQRVPEREYERREYGREFVFVRFNASMSQSFRAGEFTRETAEALRDMLNEALTERESSHE